MATTTKHTDTIIDRGAAVPDGREVMKGLPVAGAPRRRATYEILCGDARDVVPTLPQVHMVMTSPPYWRQRRYGGSNFELGNEPTLDAYLENLCDILDLIPLHRRGSLWINIGDKRHDRGGLLGIPGRFAAAMIDRGWLLLDEVIWAKGIVHPDGTTSGGFLPEPASRRLNGNAHEKLYRFARTAESWSDVCAVNIPRRNVESSRYLPPDLMSCETALEGRRCPNVWQLPMGQTRENHHASYPTVLCERPIAMTCPPWADPNGSLPERVTESVGYDEVRGTNRVIGKRIHEDDRQRCGRNDTGRSYVPRKPVTLGWTDMDPAGFHGIVLDPFCGSGTTGEVALKLGRSFVGIDLYESFCEMARGRCDATRRFLEEHHLDPLALMR